MLAARRSSELEGSRSAGGARADQIAYVLGAITAAELVVGIRQRYGVGEHREAAAGSGQEVKDGGMHARDRGGERLRRALADPERATRVAEIRRRKAELDAEYEPAPSDTTEAPTTHRPERSSQQ